MAATEIVQARVEPKLKAEAEKVFKSIGIDTATAIRMFLERVRREQDFPFDVRMFNDKTLKTIQRAEKGKGLSRPYNSASATMQDILGKEHA
jgi:DNA-damage-inducible protein J